MDVVGYLNHGFFVFVFILVDRGKAGNKSSSADPGSLYTCLILTIPKLASLKQQSLISL